MKRNKDVRSGEQKKALKHPMSQKLVAGLLCICLSVMSLPMEPFGHLAQAAQKQEIVMFLALSRDMKEKTVNVGTEQEKLELPDTLIAVCQQPKEGMAQVQNHLVRIVKQEQGEAVEPENTVDGTKVSESEPPKEKLDSVPFEEKPSVEETEPEPSKPGSSEEKPEPSKPGVSEEESEPSKPGSSEEEPEPSKPGSSTEESGPKPSGPASPEEELEPEGSGSGEETEPVEVPEEPGSGEETEPVEEPGEPGSGEETEPVEVPEEPGSGEETEPVEVPGEPGREQTEIVTIKGIIWNSEPEYDPKTEGCYRFTPVLPEEYILAEGVALPEIIVTVTQGKDTKFGNEKRKAQEDDLRHRTEERDAEILYSEARQGDSPTVPGCGIIKQDTVWGAGTLDSGELIIEPGKTLTINGALNINGNVKISGGGRIVRGTEVAAFLVNRGKELSIENIALEGGEISSGVSLIQVKGKGKLTMGAGSSVQNCKATIGGSVIKNETGGTIILNDAVIQNCSSTSNGGAIFSGGMMELNGTVLQSCSSSYAGGAISMTSSASLTIEYATIENCTAYQRGGAISNQSSRGVVIRDGIFRNNKTTNSGLSSYPGGGFMYTCSSRLTIYGGQFIGNTAPSHGGVFYHCGCSGTTTDIRGGYFSGNTCTNAKYYGSGAIYSSTQFTGNTSLILSGKVHFCGDGNSASGVDGVYLDRKSTSELLRKIKISDRLSYPVTLYLEASEGRVIAEGLQYQLLKERDMKKINFVDVSGSGKKWYAILDEEKNEVYLSETDPEYGYFVYYISNGAQGDVSDDTSYQIGETTQVKSADGLHWEKHTFVEWNTQEDGEGVSYQPGDSLEIQGDTDLFAIFKEGLAANFYSGRAGQKEIITVEILEDDDSAVIKAPRLKELELSEKAEETEETKFLEEWEQLKNPKNKEQRGRKDTKGWEPVGWETDADGYEGEIQPDQDIVLTNNANYYGVYKKDVTLTYVIKGMEAFARKEPGECRANVHEEEVSISPAEFTVVQGLERSGSFFVGWNTKPDGTGKEYKEGDTFQTQEDLTLYAIYKKTLSADFYSGKAGQKEAVDVEIFEDETSGIIRAPELKVLDLLEEEKTTVESEVSKESEVLAHPENAKQQETKDAASWAPAGWDVAADGYAGKIQPEEDIVLTENTSYYGVYKKDVTLTYEAKGIENFPKEDSVECRANVHKEEVTISPAEFTVIQGPEREGSVFTGWNTKPDGTGEEYKEGDTIHAKEDVALYAIYEKTLAADFYSGSAGRKETELVSVSGMEIGSGTLVTQKLMEMDGWKPIGWDLQEDGYDGEIQQEKEISLERDTSFYGIYEKGVTLSYEEEEAGETLPCRANIHEEATYKLPEFTLAPAPARQGYQFKGWNTRKDGKGESYQAESRQVFDQDTVLYASWEANTDTPYCVEHYKQDLTGENYIQEDSDQEQLAGTTDSHVEAVAKEYVGFTENTSHASRNASGKILGDGSLVLRLYYDRDIYQVDFDLNGGEGETPKSQTVRYGCPVAEVEEPVKRGYTFKGWYLDSAGTPGARWDFGENVEKNTASFQVTLYAKWVDDIAPVIGKASFHEGQTNLLRWLIGKTGLVVTVPITEEGSGVDQAMYQLVPNVTETGKESTHRSQGIYGKAYGAARLPFGVVTFGGSKAGNGKTGTARVSSQGGENLAEFTIDEDFKGTIFMACTDRAGNVSARKALTAKGGGVIVEDNAPQIRFTAEEKLEAGSTAAIEVEVKDDAGENISGGIAGISYCIDYGEKEKFPAEEFSEGIVESYRFTVEVSGSGSHTLYVEAVDNAGNWNEHKMSLEIPAEGVKAASPGEEPKTGDTVHVEVYATVSMIAGFTYLLLYFNTKEHGMTEEKKDELVSRLICWAKGKGDIQRMFALVLIFLLLAYYHSIGKKVSDEWKEMYVKQKKTAF